MTQKLCLNDLLVKYIYNDCSEVEIDEIREAVLTDDQAAEQLVQLLGTREALNKITYTPKNSTVKNILDYSKGISDKFRSN